MNEAQIENRRATRRRVATGKSYWVCWKNMSNDTEMLLRGVICECCGTITI
jgi:hypothetical protein